NHSVSAPSSARETGRGRGSMAGQAATPSRAHHACIPRNAAMSRWRCAPDPASHIGGERRFGVSSLNLGRACAALFLLRFLNDSACRMAPMIAALALAAYGVLLVLAALSDLRSFRIPNVLVAALAMLYPAAALLLGHAGEMPSHFVVGL